MLKKGGGMYMLLNVYGQRLLGDLTEKQYAAVKQVLNDKADRNKLTDCTLCVPEQAMAEGGMQS